MNLGEHLPIAEGETLSEFLGRVGIPEEGIKGHQGNYGKTYQKRQPIPSDGGWQPWFSDEAWNALETAGLVSAPLRVYRRWAKRAAGTGQAENSKAIQRAIADDAGCAFSSVWKVTQKLVQAGILVETDFVRNKKAVKGYTVKGYKLPPRKVKAEE